MTGLLVVGRLLVLAGQFSSSSPSLQSSVPSHRTLLIACSLLNWPKSKPYFPKRAQIASHLGTQLPSAQVRWSGGQVGFEQPDSSLKYQSFSCQKVKSNGGNDDDGEVPSILAVYCAIAPQRAPNATVITVPLI